MLSIVLWKWVWHLCLQELVAFMDTHLDWLQTVSTSWCDPSPQWTEGRKRIGKRHLFTWPVRVPCSWHRPPEWLLSVSAPTAAVVSSRHSAVGHIRPRLVTHRLIVDNYIHSVRSWENKYKFFHFIQWQTVMFCCIILLTNVCRAQWLRGRASDYHLRRPKFESCAVVLKSLASVFTLHCSSSLNCMNTWL